MAQWSVLFYLLAWLVGLGSPAFCSIYIPLFPVVLGAAVCVCMHGVRFLRIPAAFGLAFAIGYISLCQSISNQMPQSLEQRNIQLVLRVEGIPHVNQPFTRFNAEVMEVLSLGATDPEGGKFEPNCLLGKKVRLSWRRAYDEKKSTQVSKSVLPEEVLPGDYWRVTVRLKRPRGLVNPGGFDYQAWLLQQNIFATGYIHNSEEATRLRSAQGWSVDRLRHLLAGKLKSSLADSQQPSVYHSLLQALLIGDKSDISSSQWDVLNRTGTTHLMAISGLHIGLVAMFAFFCSRLFIPLIMWQTRPFILRLLPSFMCFSAACFYAVLADFSIPTQRALLFIGLINLAYVTGWRVSIFFWLLVVAIVVVLINPFAFLQAGFWLSFTAVFCLLFCFSHRTLVEQKWKTLIKAQWVVFVGLLVPLLALGLPVSLVAPLVNLIVVPVVSFCCIPFLLAGALVCGLSESFAALLFQVAESVMHGVWLLLSFVSSRANLYQSPLHLGWIVFLVPVFVIVILLPWRLRCQLPVLVVLFSVAFHPSAHRDRIVVLDVGQGLAVSVLANDGADRIYSLQYDTGARFSENFNLGERVVIPFMRHAQVKHLDTLLVSHGDNDHAGGLAAIVEQFPPREIISGALEGELQMLASSIELAGSDKDGLSTLKRPGDVTEKPYAMKQGLNQHRFCVSGQQWKKGEFDFTVLWPIDTLQAQEETQRNNQSCVLLVRAYGKTLLFTGDIENKVERFLLASGVLPSDIDVLIAPHHGSKSSSSKAFVNHLSPTHVIFSAGYRNRYHHPSAEIVARYRDAGSTLWNTASDGAISLKFNAVTEQLEVVSERERQARLWFRAQN
ncbi:ComE operon protein 3 [Thalassocella blandensis]|nr:ComE operon protein 3 [Thalassocella blandensis]